MPSVLTRHQIQCKLPTIENSENISIYFSNANGTQDLILSCEYQSHSFKCHPNLEVQRKAQDGHLLFNIPKKYINKNGRFVVKMQGFPDSEECIDITNTTTTIMPNENRENFTPTQPKPFPDSKNKGISNDNHGLQLGLGLGLTASLLVFAVLIFVFYKYKKRNARKRGNNSKAATGTIALKESRFISESANSRILDMASSVLPVTHFKLLEASEYEKEDCPRKDEAIRLLKDSQNSSPGTTNQKAEDKNDHVVCFDVQAAVHIVSSSEVMERGAIAEEDTVIPGTQLYAHSVREITESQNIDQS